MNADLALDKHFAADRDDPLGHAFGERTRFPWIQRGTKPLTDPLAAYGRLTAAARPGRKVAYVHVPFCSNHCLFCGFYRHRSSEEALSDYADRLAAELAIDDAAPGGGPVLAVYFGGGTPSALGADDLGRLIALVRERLPLAPDCEITVEGRVVGFDADKIDACLDAGANRFSIGVQTFDTTLRRRLGRKADREQVVAFLSKLRERDRAAVVCDLIFGLPGQDMDGWRRDVRTCVELGLDGADLYCLTLHEGGPLAVSIAKGALPLPAPLDQLARFYAAGLDILEDAGWRHLTQAHWASGSRERNLYNHLVKSGVDCLAFGSGAGGLLDGHRFVVDGDRESYERRAGMGEKPVAVVLPPPRHRRARDLVMGSLEAGRLDFDRLDAAMAPGFSALLAPLFDQWAEAGLLRRRSHAVELTTPGWFWHCNLVGSLFELMGAFAEGGADARIHPPNAEQGNRHDR